MTCSIDGCTNKPKYVVTGWCQKHYHRYWRTGSVEIATKELRTDLTYYGAHGRVKTAFGSATKYVCIECGSDADEWSYDGTDPSEKSGSVSISGQTFPVRYSVWPEFYVPMCTRCHRSKDRRAWSDRRELCKNGHELTLDNIYTRPSRPGERACKTCRAEDSRKRYRKRRDG